MSPEDFWRMSVAEWSMLASGFLSRSAEAMTKNDLMALLDANDKASLSLTGKNDE